MAAVKNMSMRRRFIPLFLVLFTACNLQNPRPPAALSPTASPTPPIAAAVPSTAAPLPSPSDNQKYIMDVIVDYDRHQVTVDETILYPNNTGQTLNALTLAVAPNLWPGCFSLLNIAVNDVPLTKYGLNGHRLELTLPAPLGNGNKIRIRIRYALSLPYMDQVNSLRARIFGYSDLQMNLVNWYPYVVPFMNGEWMIREPWSHGEYLVYPVANYEVNLVFAGGGNPPVVASSGYAEVIGDFTRFSLVEGRAFAFSISRDFQVASLKVGDITVMSYFFPLYRGAGEAAMLASAQAVRIYSQKFGAYPHQSLSVVTADFRDSMEFSGLYFHSRSFYDLYDGTPRNYLTYVAAHETAHQWWFEQVASDQALEPWLDESLTTYSEVLYLEEYSPDSVQWWWSNRIDFFRPQGYIDIRVYDAENDDAYKQTVYFNGARFLQDLRARVGDPAFFAFLQDYYLQNRGEIAGREDFFRILAAHTNADITDVVNRYFRLR